MLCLCSWYSSLHIIRLLMPCSNYFAMKFNWTLKWNSVTMGLLHLALERFNLCYFSFNCVIYSGLSGRNCRTLTIYRVCRPLCYSWIHILFITSHWLKWWLRHCKISFWRYVKNIQSTKQWFLFTIQKFCIITLVGDKL